MRVLIIGSGGREHAMARALAGDNRCTLLCAPGNPGTATLGRNVALAVTDIAGILQLVQTEKIELVIPGPEVTLCAGLVDALRSQPAVLCCGPTPAAARLESSKAFTRTLCDALRIPSPAYRIVTNQEQLAVALRTFSQPPVVKADGLCAGKGVFLNDSFAECEVRARQLLRGALGAAGQTVVLEERLDGIEASLFFACHGESYLSLPHARDYKRLRDGDEGPNTGGMGAVSPHPLISAALEEQVVAQMVQPILRELKSRGTPFVGFLFVGLMLTAQGPRLLEFNVRLGDPEAQVVLPRLGTGEFLRLCLATARGELRDFHLDVNPQPTCAIVLASAGYPERVGANETIFIDESLTNPHRYFIHAGTTQRDAMLQVSGGRVGAIVAHGDAADHARAQAYAGLLHVRFVDMQYRRDIGL